MYQAFSRSSVDALLKEYPPTNPSLTQQWIDCKEQIALLEDRLLQYHEDGDEEAIGDARFLLSLEQADCRALERAGAAPGFPD
jgi:hypothetical protein